jgi:hypothetical protein
LFLLLISAILTFLSFSSSLSSILLLSIRLSVLCFVFALRLFRLATGTCKFHTSTDGGTGIDAFARTIAA